MTLFPILASIILLGMLLAIAYHFRQKMNKPLKRLAAVAAIALVGITIAAAFKLKSQNSSDSAANGWTWDNISWRAQLFARKAEGDLPDLSWRELWFMTHVRGGFGLEGFVKRGFSLEGSLDNPFETTADHQNGDRIFRERCAVCHGDEGTGGHAPQLSHLGLNHGDSDVAIYKVTRDGIPQTGMAPVPMSPQERWQLVGYVRTLQLATSHLDAQQLPPIDMHVSNEQILSAGSKTDQWLTYSGSLDGKRYTPLNEITPENASRLRIRWVRQFGSSDSRSESTPIVVDGVIFNVESPSDVVALDAKSGDLRWHYTRSLPEKLPICCARANRGLAVLGNVLYMGSLDGYLVALNATNGNVIWQTQVVKPSDGFTITGAPLIVNGSVIVGVAGGEFGIRGILAAYDAETGRQKWTFNTIPGPGEIGHDSWKNDAWKTGGGPTWITGSYDPSLDLLYWGVGNPSPDFRGEDRPGDNLFTDSIIALHASSGKLAWYFQFTPHDDHDWDAAQTPVLADIPINGVLRQVICMPNRNGFYYVLDRTTGEFLVGAPFVVQDWAKSLDSAGRPILSANAPVSRSGRLSRPGVGGGVNWQNPALDQKKGSIFVPATEGAAIFTEAPTAVRGELGLFGGSHGSDVVEPDHMVRALDVATGAKKWDRFSPKHRDSLFNGYSGLLATGGGLVFGASEGFAFAIDSATGNEVWRVFMGGDTYAAPISFTVDGHQVVLVSAGRVQMMFGL